MTTLDNGVVVDESSWNSQNFTAAAQVPSVYGMPRKISSVTVHHWGDPAWNQKFNAVADYLSRPGGDTSAHFVVEAGRVARLISPDHAAWHAGSAAGNATSIGIEMNPRASEDDMQTLASLIRWLESVYGSLMVYRHSDWFGTACPGAYADKIGHIVDLVNGGKASAVISSGSGSGGMVYPVDPAKYRITQSFSDDLTNVNASASHGAIDFATPVGTSVKATADGTVIFADWSKNLTRASDDARYWIGDGEVYGVLNAGIIVLIDHGDFISEYAHLNETPLNAGDKVKMGQEIGRSGDTGYVFGAHLHWGVMRKPIDFDNDYYGRSDPELLMREKNKKAATQKAAAFRVELNKEKTELSVLTEKFKNFKTGGQTDAATELGWLPQNFQNVLEGISNIRLEMFNQKILKQGGTQKKGETTSLALEVSYLADNFARTHQALDRIEKRVAQIDARLAKIEGK